MAVTWFNVPFNVGMLGIAGAVSTRVQIETNVPEGDVVYPTANFVYGSGAILDFEGGVGILRLPTRIGANPATFEYKVTLEVVRKGGKRQELGPYYLSAPAVDEASHPLAEWPGTSSAPASWMTTATAQLTAAGQSALASTVTARDQAIVAKGQATDARDAALAAASTAATNAASNVAGLIAADRTAVAADRAYVEGIVVTDLATTDGQSKALIESPTSETRAALDNAYAGRTITPTESLRVYGHSFGAGVTNTTPAGAQGLAPLAAAKLRLPLSQYAVGGSTLVDSTALSSWATVMQHESRPRARFAPRGGAYAIVHGINDLNRLGNTMNGLRPYRHALRAVVARFNCSTVFDDADSTVTFGGAGAWSYVTSSGTTNSGTRLSYNPTSGATFTITTPADFPGGTISVGLIQWQAGGTYTLTGPSSLGSPVFNSAEMVYTETRTTGVMRIQNVPKGSAAYTFTATTNNAPVGLVFDWWGWEPDGLACPVVAVVSQTKPLDYSGYGAGGAFGPPSDAGVDNINSIHQDIAAEFGPKTVYVDATFIDKKPAYFGAGNVHPNLAGHAYIGDRIAGAITEASSFVIAPSPVETESSGGGETTAASWAAYVPAFTGTGTALGDGLASGSYVKDAAGTVHFYARIILKSTSTVGTTVNVSLPVAALATGSYSALSGWWQTSAGFGALTVSQESSTTTVRVRTIGALGVAANVTTTSPVTWALNDVIEVRGTYRAAP